MLLSNSISTVEICLTCSHLQVVQFAFNQEEVEHVCEHESHHDYQHDRKYSREKLLENANGVHLVEVREGRSHQNIVVDDIWFDDGYRGAVAVGGGTVGGNGDVVVADGRGLLSVQPVTALDAALSKPP